MMAPAGHVTVVVVKALVADPQAVENSDGEPDRLADTVRDAVTLWPKVGVRDDVGATDDEREREAAAEAEREREAAAEADTLSVAARVCTTERDTEPDRDAVTLRPKETDGDCVGFREDERDGLADALTSLHCT